MKILRKSGEIRDFLSLLKMRASGSLEGIEGVVKEILYDVKRHGDRSVLKYTEKFDSLKIIDLLIKHAELDRYASHAK